MYDEGFGWRGYADAKPSEAIQKHSLPGLAVAVVFPFMSGTEVLEIPGKQYKDYDSRRKGAAARKLAEWLGERKEDGLRLAGFSLCQSQPVAAEIGLSLLEELPDTHVEEHYEGYRLHFGSECVDLAQAVALEYYLLAMSLGILRAGSKLPSEKRKLFVAMDRFPGKSTGEVIPGSSLPPTQGMKFVRFVRNTSRTHQGIRDQNREIQLLSDFGTLDWWKWKAEQDWRAGKSHPHFLLPDWLAAAATAHDFRDELVSTFGKASRGEDAANGLEELYSMFKRFDIWSIAGDGLPLRGAEQRWSVPDAAREFVLARAER